MELMPISERKIIQESYHLRTKSWRMCPLEDTILKDI